MKIEKLISQKLIGGSNNLRFELFADPVSHFGAPWWPFWILQARRCNFSGGAALQVVSEYLRAARLVLLLVLFM